MPIKEDVKTLKSKNVRLFTHRPEAFDYLVNDVFEKQEFIDHIIKTANYHNVSYMIAYSIITNHLTDILYEVDQRITSYSKKSKIRILGHFYLSIGFIRNYTKVLNNIKNKKK